MPSLRKASVLGPVVVRAAKLVNDHRLGDITERAARHMADVDEVLTRCGPGKVVTFAAPSDLLRAAVFLHGMLMVAEGIVPKTGIPSEEALAMAAQLDDAIELAIANDRADGTLDRYQPWQSKDGGTRLITGVPEKVVEFIVEGEQHTRVAPVSGFYEWIDVFGATLGDQRKVVSGELAK